MTYHVSKSEFGRLVERALAELPEQFRAFLAEVPVQIEWAPSRRMLKSLGMEEDELRKRLETRGAHIKTVKLSYDFEKRHKTMAFEIRLKRATMREACRSLLTEIANSPGIIRATWE